MRHIVAGTDGSRGAERAIEVAAELAAKADADLLIVHVATLNPLSERERELAVHEHATEILGRLPELSADEPAGPPIFPDLLSREAIVSETVRTVLGEDVLARAETAARASGARKVHTLLAHGDPARTLLSVAQENAADVIVVGSRGFGELKSVLLGSVSHKIANNAQCTVVIAKQPDWEHTIVAS